MLDEVAEACVVGDLLLVVAEDDEADEVADVEEANVGVGRLVQDGGGQDVSLDKNLGVRMRGMESLRERKERRATG